MTDQQFSTTDNDNITSTTDNTKGSNSNTINAMSNNDNVTNDDDDDNDDEQNNPNLPLLHFERRIKVGPFSIRYNKNNTTNTASSLLTLRQQQQRASRRRFYKRENSSGQFVDFKSGAYCEEEEEDELLDNDNVSEEEDELDHIQNYHQYKSRPLQIIHKLHHSLSKCIKPLTKHLPKLLPPRILLLSLHLALTLSSFWILDSLKEPTLAILVGGQLGKHQPRAKMVSFVVVVGIGVGMEWGRMVRERSRSRGRRRVNDEITSNGAQNNDEGDITSNTNADIERSWADRNLPTFMQRDSTSTTGSSRWKKMGIRTSQHFWKHFHWAQQHPTSNNNGEDEESSSSKITTLAFYIVGSLYIHFFVTVAVALQSHPSFRPSILNKSHDTGLQSNAGIDEEEDTEDHESWYYPALGYTLFALIESYGSVSITLFWAFANSHLTLEAAERHYGSIIALAQAGAIGGSTLSAVMGRRRRQLDEDVVDISFEHENNDDARVTPVLIFLACGCIGAGMAIMALYSQLFAKPMRQQQQQQLQQVESQQGLVRRAADAEDDGGNNIKSDHCHNGRNSSGIDTSTFKELFGGVHMIFRHEYLKLVLAVSVLYEIALTCMHYEMNLIGLDRFGVGISIVDESSELQNDSHQYHNHDANTNTDDEGITYIQFMGWYGQTVNILSLFLSFYAFPRLIKNYGLRTTIRIFPTVLLLVTIFAFVLFPQNLYFLFVSLSLCKALTYSVHDPSEEVLYMPTSDDAKFRAKFWIDVVGQRIAKALGSAINNYAGSIEGIVKYGSLPSVVASLALWLACYQVGILFDGLIRSGQVVGLDDGKEVVEASSYEDEVLEEDDEVDEVEDGENSNADVVGQEDGVLIEMSSSSSSKPDVSKLK